MFDFKAPSTEPIEPPKSGTDANLNNFFNASLNKNLSQAKNTDVKVADKEGSEIYRLQDEYNPVGFDSRDPGNNEKFAGYDTWGNTMGKALDDFGYKFSNSFMEGAYSTGRILRSIFTLGAYGLNKDEDDVLQQYYKDLHNDAETHVFLNAEDEDKFFNKRFVKDFLAQTGFTLGTVAEMAVETAITLGAGSLISTGTKAGGLLAKATAQTATNAAAKELGKESFEKVGKKIATVATEAETARNTAKWSKPLSELGSRTMQDMQKTLGMNVKNVAEAEGLWNKILTTAENIPVAGEALRTGRQIARVGASGADALEIAKIGFSGFRRGVQEMTLAVSEAAFEGVSAHGEAYTSLLSDFQLKNGRPPEGKELDDIRETANKIGGAVFNTNTGILLAANKIQFGNMFSKFAPTNKLVRELMTDEAADAVTTVVKSGAKRKLYEKGFMGQLGITRQIAEDFDKKVAAKELGKSMLKGMSKFEGSEGIQELLQNMTSSSAKEFYINEYNHKANDLLETITGSAKEQWSEEGLKTFLMGAFTGRLVAMPMHISSYMMGRLNNTLSGTTESVAKEKESRTNDIAVINKLLYNVGDGIDEHVRNFQAQAVASEKMTEAAGKGDEFNFHNAKNDALYNAVRAAMRTNTLDVLVDSIHDVGEEYTPEQFKESYGMDLAETEFKTTKQFTDRLADQVDNYGKTYKSLVRKFGPIVDPYIYPKDSSDRRRAMMAQNTLYDTIDFIAMNSFKANNRIERAKQIMNNFAKVPELAGSSEYAFRVLTQPSFLESEISLLNSEISSMKMQYKETLDPNIKEQIENKREEIRLLGEFRGYYNIDKAGQIEGENDNLNFGQFKYTFIGDMSKDTFKNKGYTEDELLGNQQAVKVQETIQKLLNLKNKQVGNKTTVSTKTVRDNIRKFVDYIKLDTQAKEYTDALELLTDPNNFIKMHMRMTDGYYKYFMHNQLAFLEDALPMFIARAKMEEFVGDTSDKISEMTRVYEEAISFVTENESYKKLLAIYLSQTQGIETYAVSDKLYEEVRDALKKKYDLKSEEDELKETLKETEAEKEEVKAEEEVEAKPEEESEEEPKEEPESEPEAEEEYINTLVEKEDEIIPEQEQSAETNTKTIAEQRADIEKRKQKTIDGIYCYNSPFSGNKSFLVANLELKDSKGNIKDKQINVYEENRRDKLLDAINKAYAPELADLEVQKSETAEVKNVAINKEYNAKLDAELASPELPTVEPQTVNDEVVDSIDAKKAKIEILRNEALRCLVQYGQLEPGRAYGWGISYNPWEKKYEDVKDDFWKGKVLAYNNNKQIAIDKINAKYDADLAALEATTQKAKPQASATEETLISNANTINELETIWNTFNKTNTDNTRKQKIKDLVNKRKQVIISTMTSEQVDGIIEEWDKALMSIYQNADTKYFVYERNGQTFGNFNTRQETVTAINNKFSKILPKSAVEERFRAEETVTVIDMNTGAGIEEVSENEFSEALVLPEDLEFEDPNYVDSEPDIYTFDEIVKMEENGLIERECN